MRRECRERFPRHRLHRKSLVIDPSMHVPWCMSGSITRGGGENVPSVPGACASCNFAYLVRGSWLTFVVLRPTWKAKSVSWSMVSYKTLPKQLPSRERITTACANVREWVKILFYLIFPQTNQHVKGKWCRSFDKKGWHPPIDQTFSG